MNEIKMARPAQKPKTEKSQVAGSKLEQQIYGKLTSRIEQKGGSEPYYYGFFKLINRATEIPVVFKSKPDLKKGSLVELMGNWAQSNNSRPSFTCSGYEVVKEAIRG